MKFPAFARSIHKATPSLSVLCGLALAALSGCATTASQPPSPASSLQVQVHWASRAEITQRCGPGQLACRTAGTPEDPRGQIWARKPSSFDDSENVCALGEVLLGLLQDDAARAGVTYAQANVGGATEPLLR
jgi:hypothetical protein